MYLGNCSNYFNIPYIFKPVFHLGTDIRMSLIMTPCYVSGWTSFSQMFMSDSCCSLCPKVCQINRILGTDGEVRNWHSSHVPYHPSCPSGWKKQSSTSTHVSLVVLPIACQIYVIFLKNNLFLKKRRKQWNLLTLLLRTSLQVGSHCISHWSYLLTLKDCVCHLPYTPGKRPVPIKLNGAKFV